MNDPGFLAVIAWRTMNKRKHAKVENLLKDYGLQKLQTSLYTGRLTSKERDEIESTMISLLPGKRDQWHLFISCKSCSQYASDKSIFDMNYQAMNFEIV